MAKLLVYATKGGDTKVVGEYIANKLGFEAKEAKDLTADDLANANALVLAVSTHGDGQIHAKFDDKLDLLNSTDLGGKKVALVGVGNQERHPDDFCSGLAAFLPVLKKANLVGLWGAEGYKFNYSRAFINGKFLGLTIDFKGDKEWQTRADKWISEFKNEF
ncbi:flavodoxin domain-containing protein [Campylobacter sp. CS_ED2]|uniref:flavodoxin domain-containing protein n=1 Tax=Campylobacter sp. CS_ED2 TaxID=2984141 RepID=UPI0022EA0E49|nr:flavodoxin domain-containing protein [Campylobacter sp. CS_ED2]MDA3090768.1 flavodoxin domain-containing protein [Campylobacter sp. CS_ED2]